MGREGQRGNHYIQKITFLCRFSSTAVRAIAENVVTATLAGKSWAGEEETVWAVSISEQIKQKIRGWL